MIDYQALKNRPFPEVVHTYAARDTMLYALGLGYGHDPMDERQLAYVYEKGLVAAPTMAVVMALPGFWVKEPDTGIDWVRVLHGEHSVTLHRPLPVAATVVGHTRIKALVDKGSGRGALIVLERSIRERDSGDLLATIEQVTFARGDGGFSEAGGSAPPGGDASPPPRPATPESEPDAVCELPTLPQAALLYRLCGDYNPLHAEPAVAKSAGFARPILHGLATYGVAGHAILRTFCDYDPARLHALSVRFSAPVYPGETIRTEMWRSGARVQFRARALGLPGLSEEAVQPGRVVLSHGLAEIA